MDGNLPSSAQSPSWTARTCSTLPARRSTTYPNYDVSALAEQVCTRQGWKLAQVRFYTGIPDAGDNPGWHAFWAHKLAAMGRRGVVVFSSRSDTATAGLLYLTAASTPF